VTLDSPLLVRDERVPRRARVTTVTCVSDRVLLARLADALGGYERIASANQLGELEAMVAETFPDVVIVELRSAPDAALTAVVRTLTERFPSTAVIVSAALCASHVRELVALSRLGIADCILGSDDESPRQLFSLMTRATLRSRMSVVSSALSDDMPPMIRRMVAYTLGHADDQLSVAQVAHGLGVDRRTLYNHCRTGGAPSPHAVVGWCRLLAAALYLDDPGRDVDQIARALAFPSGSALRNQLRRYTGLTTSELRRAGALQTVLNGLRDALRSGNQVEDDAVLAAPARRTEQSAGSAALTARSVTGFRARNPGD
jgi:AraC-like DNA-binding protein